MKYLLLGSIHRIPKNGGVMGDVAEGRRPKTVIQFLKERVGRESDQHVYIHTHKHIQNVHEDDIFVNYKKGKSQIQHFVSKDIAAAI